MRYSPFQSGINLKEKDNHIESVPKKELPKNSQSSNSNNKKRNHPANEKFVGNSKSVVILGDSMIKHLNGWEMSKKVNNPGCKIYVKHFARAKTICMKDYMQPSLRNAPNHFILHVGTNDLTWTKQLKVLRIL